MAGDVKLGRTRLGTPAPVREPRTDPLASTVAALESQPVVAHAPLAPGVEIQQYELIRELGRGGMGVVYAARDRQLGRRVAIKFLLQANEEIAERFRVEARATAQCTHDNIVIIHDVGEYGNMPYMVLEFLEGQSLRDKLGGFEAGRPLPASRVVELALPIARALARAHEMGIVHRDLKPENVFVTTSGQVKVLDFGIAKALVRNEGRVRGSAPAIERAREIVRVGSLTQDGALIGTVPYMSPEQFTQQVELDHRSDLWSLGILMFEMLAGRHPARAQSADAIVELLVDEAPVPSIASLVPETPPQLARLVDACLRRRRDERIASAAELVRRLEELVPGRRRREFAEGECPYPGLAAFQEHDADRFFGRDREVARMVARVRDLPLTAVVGPSGTGKSSFVRAGVVPALKASGERWEALTVRPGRQPLAALASTLERLRTSRQDARKSIEQHAQLVEQLRREPGCLGTLLRARATESEHDILLFVDQFEELYTLVDDPAERRAFTAALAGAADDIAAPVRVVLSMRSDFLDRMAEDPRFVEEVSRGLVFLGPTDHAGLREALVEPAEMVGYRFESEAMVEDMLRDLAATAGALPLLQFAATKLWDVRDRHARLFTVASYRACGGVTGALAVHADEVVAAMDAMTRALARKICRALVTPERTRAIAELADLERLALDPADARRVVDQLVAARLVVVQTRGDSDGATVELVHESLIERWPTLRRWLDEDQDDAAFAAQLATAAKQWEARQHAPGLLWRGQAMEDARRWYTERPRQLPARDQAFIDAVLALGRRSKRARRLGLIAAFVVLGGIAAGSSIAYVRVRDAERVATAEAERAKREERRASAALDKERVANKAALEAEQSRLIALAALLTEEQLREAAEAGLISAKQMAAIAEERRQLAERRRLKAEQDRAAVAAALEKSEADRAAAEQAARQHAQDAQMTREQLLANKQRLEAALAIAKTERARAESARAEAERAKGDLQRALAAEKARVKELEGKISTKLK